MSLVVLTNIPTPYRTAFFDALAESAKRAGKSFHVLYCAKTEPGRHWPYDPAKMKHAHTVLRGFHPKFAGAFAHINVGVLSQLNLLKPDTIIFGGAWNTPTMLIARISTYSPRPRRFFWSEGHAGAALHKGGLIAFMRRRVYRMFDGFAVPNNASADWALAQTGDQRTILTLPNSIDAKAFMRPTSTIRFEARQQLNLPDEGRVLVQVSTLTDRKGVLNLAKAFLSLPTNQRGRAKLLFVGDGDRRAELEAIASKSGDAIRILGQMPAEDVCQVLWAADAFVLNTNLDPNPLSAIEASAAGLPIVMSSAAGNIREVVEEPNAGFVIRNPDDPSDALRWVLNASDTELAAMGARAATNAKRFDASSVAKGLIHQLYPQTS